MTNSVSQLYRASHPDIEKRIILHIAKGCEAAPSPVRLFFRTDDIGVPSKKFTDLITCFRKHQLPLCLATVPSWLTRSRYTEILQQTGGIGDQWLFHQHGRLHKNFELTGKKQEFGPSRSKQDILHSLRAGKNRLEQLLDNNFFPVFTPPWNRCSIQTLESLIELNFKAVSRSHGAKPPTLPQLPDLQVRVDLHTRKESSPHESMNNLLTELEEGLASGLCGIMIHHQRMDKAAVDFLDLLLTLLNSQPGITPLHFGDLLT